MTAETEINQDSFFADILAAIDYDQPAPEVVREQQTVNLTERLNAMIEAGASFDVGLHSFQTFGADCLSSSGKDFLSVNKSAILCTLQQSLLVKYLFSHSQSLFSDFAFEITERESILTETGAITYEAHLEAVREITEKWFARLLN